MLARLAFAMLYLVVDVVYVMIFQGSYQAVVQRIQSRITRIDGSRYITAIGAYLAMALGWSVLVAEQIENSSDPRLAALKYGFVFGIAVYGVFNFTNYVMFQEYTPKIMLQDMLWGTTWSTTLSLLYGMYIVSTRK